MDDHQEPSGDRAPRDVHDEPGAGVAWLSPPSERDHRRLEPWRQGVGPALTASLPVAPSTRHDEPTPSTGFTVAVWNTRVGGGALTAWWEAVRGVAGADPVILLLQEVFRTREGASPGRARQRDAVYAGAIREEPAGERRMDVGTFAREAGLACFYAPSMGNGGAGEDRGNAVLADVPLSMLTAIELPFERQRRVAVAATVDVGPRRVQVCSVHLDNRAPWRRAWRSLGSGRARQMGGLLAAFDSSSPAVLGGDLNTWVGGTGERAFRLARARFPDPAVLDARPTHRFELGGFLRRSDHLLLRLGPEGEATVTRMDSPWGSDHYPLVARVRW